MQDFNEYLSSGEGSFNGGANGNGQNYNQNGGFAGNGSKNGGNIFDLVSSIAKKFDGKNQNDLLKAIYEEALKGKRNGTLTNADIDNFVAVLSPALDNKQRKILHKISEELKKI